jgi:pimeloyl-ACP methyl ester carboxylesterase
MLQSMWGDRLTDRWMHFKVRRWRESSDVAAVVGYIRMYARDGLPDLKTAIAGPVLAVTGEQDSEIMRSAAVTKLLSPLCKQLTVTPLAECGHYPMQEAPPLLVTIVQRFLIADADGAGA